MHQQSGRIRSIDNWARDPPRVGSRKYDNKRGLSASVEASVEEYKYGSLSPSPYFAAAIQLLESLEEVTFLHVPRLDN